MKTMDGMRMLLNFAVLEKCRTWRLSLFGRGGNNTFVLPVFGSRKSPAMMVCFAVVVLFLGALSVPADARPTYGGGEGYVFGGQIDHEGPFRLFAGKFLSLYAPKTHLVHVGNPIWTSGFGDCERPFEAHNLLHRRGTFAYFGQRSFLGGHQGWKYPNLGSGLRCSFDAPHGEWPGGTDQTPPVVPAPGAIVLGSIGAGLVGWLRRRKTL